MLNKRIYVFYVNNGNMASIVSKEVMFNSIINQMTDEGREVESTSLSPKSKSVTFKDGSKLYLHPLTLGMLGFRATHIFVDEAIKLIPNGENIINEMLKPSIIHESKMFDTSGNQFLFYTYANGKLIITQ